MPRTEGKVEDRKSVIDLILTRTLTVREKKKKKYILNETRRAEKKK